MPAATTDKFSKTFNSVNPNVARVNASRAAGVTTLACDNLAGWPTDTVVHFSTYRVSTAGAVVAGTQIDWKGIVSGNNITSLTRVAGATDAGNSINDIVEANPTGNWANDLVSGLLVQHNQDGTHGAVTATSLSVSGNASITGSLTIAGASIDTSRKETSFDFIYSGGVWTGDSYGASLNASMTAIVCYINGQRGTVSAVTARAFTASKDTYVDILNNAGTFSLVYTEVANNAVSPALAANSIRLGIIVSGANIAAAGSINQGQEDRVLPIASSIPYAVTDSLGNLICPRDPNRKILGYRQMTSSQGPEANSTTSIDITPLSCPVIVPTGRKIKISSAIQYQTTGGVGTIIANLRVMEGATIYGAENIVPSIANIDHPGYVECVTSPSAGSHTYKAAILNSAAGPTHTIDGYSTAPAFIMVELA